MSADSNPVRVLQSFPHRIGAARICDTAWQQAAGVAGAGGDVRVLAGSVHRPLPAGVRSHSTLARGQWRIPYRVLGRLRAVKLHDRLVARMLPRLRGEVDLIHTWPLGALETLRAARTLGIPTLLERPNAHTRFAYEVVQQECERLGVALPPDHEHAYNAAVLQREEEEYALADRLLCPSDFTARTFHDRGFPERRLARHVYGYDRERFYPAPDRRPPSRGLTVLFVGVCAVRKGVHFALQAWLASPASKHGKLQIAGEFLPAYADELKDMLEQPSVEVLGHRDDVPELMRRADVFVLPSIEEGFGLVCVEAMACGCVPLVSDACTEACEHQVSGLRHSAGDIETLSKQITALHEDRDLLARLRAGCLRAAPGLSWEQAGRRLLDVYRESVSHAVEEPVAA